MLIRKNTTLRGIFEFAGHHLIWLTLWAVLIACLNYYTSLKNISIPWLPLSVIGTAVAFYVGFKNNQAYDRLWEGRKIWGGIVNSSRSWATAVNHFVSNLFTDQKQSDTVLKQYKTELIYRHIAWLYVLRNQLLVPTEWEHISLRGSFGRFGRRQKRRFGLGLFEENPNTENAKHYLPTEEFETVFNFKNAATQIIDKQSEHLATLREKNLIDDFRHMELQKLLTDFYSLQGASERIKKFPQPRQYANMSFIFVCVFVFMLPFGFISEFAKLGSWGIWLSVPFVVIVGWLYVVMELVGDYTENPFEGLYNDVPLLSICRTIEIDLLEMLREDKIPPPIASQNGVLM